MPRLLFLSQLLPFPPTGGATIRTFHVMRELSRAFDLTTLCFYRWKPGLMEPDLPLALASLGEFGRVEAFPIPQEHSRFRLLRDHLLSLSKGRVYTVSTYESSAFRSRLAELLRTEAFDLAHSDSLDLSGYFSMLNGTPIVCTHHDVQSLLLSRRAAREQWARRLYLKRQAALMRQEETTWCSRIDLNITVSETDRSKLTELVPSARCAVVPNGVDTEYFVPRAARETSVAFVGGTSWFPNKDALKYFSEEIMPEIRDAGIDAPVWWIGRATPEERAYFGNKAGLNLTGYVEDVRPYLWNAACFIVPLRIGGGTRVKILDAWATGKAVVSTSVGCEGLAAVDGENIIIRDHPRDFAKAVKEVLVDEALRRRLGDAGRQTVVDHYSWGSIGSTLRQRYLELVGDRCSFV